jgi:NAD(P)H-dependent FMN reductase
MAEQKRVMISSTARDLPEHRKQIVEACLRQGMFPLRMEDLPANSDEAVTASLKLIEEADVYIGVFANRYGYIPKANNRDQISVTEMEYNRAVARKSNGSSLSWTKSQQHLKDLNAPEPEMPPFDESKFEPMPEVEINPRDQFYVDEAELAH